MPTYALNEEEKNLIIKKHKDYINEFNQYLPDEIKLVYDEKEFNKQLNDSKNAKYYKTLEEIDNRGKKQKEIYNKLVKDFGNIDQRRDLLARSFEFQLKTDGSSEANEYNEKLYREYQSDPDKVLYKRYKAVLEFNPQQLLKVVDDKQKLLEFYLNNQALCEDALVFTSTLDNPYANINPDLRHAIKGMQKQVEGIKYALRICDADKLDYLSFPKLTSEQATAIVAGNPQKYMAFGTKIASKFDMIMNPPSSNEIKEEYEVVKNYGYTLGRGYFLKYVAEEYDPRTNETREISVDNGIKALNNNPNVTVRERSVDEIRNLLRINRVYDREYVDIWQHQFSQKYDNMPFDYNEIKEANKGGFFERFFRTTSREYNSFIKALGEFNDYNSKNFGNKKHLRDCAMAYFNHKSEQGLSFNNIDHTGRERIRLCAAVINSLDEMDNNYLKVNEEINKRIFEETPKKEQFLSGKEVEDNLIDNNIEINETLIKSKDMEL